MSADAPPRRQRPPLLPWSSHTWTQRWSAMGRMSNAPVPRTPFLLLKAPVSTVYEEKFGGDRNMFTGMIEIMKRIETDANRDDGEDADDDMSARSYSEHSPFLPPFPPPKSLPANSRLPDANDGEVGMYCSRMTARGIRVGLAIDCTSLDLEDFEPLPPSSSSSSGYGGGAVRYFHNPDEWDDFDVEYHRILPAHSHDNAKDDDILDDDNAPRPLASRALSEFCRVVSEYLRRSRGVVRESSSSSSSAAHVAVFDSRGGLGAAAYLVGGYMSTMMKAPVHVVLESLRAGTPKQGQPDDVMWGLRDPKLVRDMQVRFGGRSEVKVDGRRPTWWYHRIDDDDDEDEVEVKEDDVDEPKRKRRRMRYEGDIVIPPCIPSSTGGRGGSEGRNDGASVPPPTSLLSLSSSISPNTGPNPPMGVLEPVTRGSTRWNRAISVLSQLTMSPSSPSHPTATTILRLPLKPEVDVSDVNEGVGDELVRSVRECPDMYRVTWLSTNGRRGLLLVLSEAIYFMEQSTKATTTSESSSTKSATPHEAISIYAVTNMKFPSPKDHTKHQHRTLLDVVLVTDVEGGRSTYRFYALDMLCIEGGMVWHKPWDQRWRFLNEGVLIPRKKDEAHQSSMTGPMTHVYSDEVIKIRAVEYFPLNKISFVMTDVCDGVCHEALGVRIVSTGLYGIGLDGDVKGSSSALIWRRGHRMSEGLFKTMLVGDDVILHSAP